ncbi:MAG: DUF971 domain-containing protein [Terracidiphilus sp.]
MSHEGIRFVSAPSEAGASRAGRLLTRESITPVKVRVLLSEGKGMEIDWADGHKSAWSFRWLRAACPCATCVEEREKENLRPGESKPVPAAVLPLYTPPIKPLSVEPAGRYAIQFRWNDGHSGGIYSWEYLRSVCQCAECSPDTAQPASTQH